MFTIETSGKILRTPFFFTSLSTIKNNDKVYNLFQILKKASYPGILISSYDIYHDDKRDKLIKEVSKTTEESVFTFLDSGNYEAYWNNDKEWNITKLESILKYINVDFSFSFDVFWEENKDIDRHVEETISYSAITAGMQRTGTTIPIIHSNSKKFPIIVRKVVEGINPQIIGIPERELGDNLLERAMTLNRIRDEMNKIEKAIPIHLLGTGNPISLLIYAICGADLFDGLEWYKYAVYPRTGHIYHYSQRDLIDCDCVACNNIELPYPLQTLGHNLIFYENFTEEIRQAISNGKISEILNKYLPKKIVPQIKKIAGVI